MPFIAGTVSQFWCSKIMLYWLFDSFWLIFDSLYLSQSTSPSHSVHANVQSILHMMKHHQPQLCERVSALHRSGCGAKKSLQKAFTPTTTTVRKPEKEPEQAVKSLGSLSDLLLALQDELGQMSLWVKINFMGVFVSYWYNVFVIWFVVVFLYVVIICL